MHLNLLSLNAHRQVKDVTECIKKNILLYTETVLQFSYQELSKNIPYKPPQTSHF